MPAAQQRRPLNPYASLVDLRRSAPLGATESALTEEALDKAAKSLGIKLPRPKKMTKNEALVWRIMAGIDVSSVRLSRAYDSMIRTLGVTGGAICADLRAYNLTAMRVFAAQRAALEALKKAGAKGVPGAVPTPNLFLGMGADRLPESDGFIRCDASQPIIGFAPPDNSSGVRLMLRSPAVCPPEGGLNAPPAAVPAAIVVASNPVGWAAFGVYAVVAIGGVLAIKFLTDAWQDAGKYEATVEAAVIESEYEMFRAAAVERMATNCAAALPPGSTAGWKCVDAANKAIPKGLAAIAALKELADAEKRGVIWYIGAGVVVLALGYGAWKWRSGRAGSGGDDEE